MPLASLTIAAALSLVLSREPAPASAAGADAAVLSDAAGGETAAVRRLARDLPGFQIRTGRRFVLLSDLPPEEAAATLAQLEATADAVELFAKSLAIEARPIDRRLISVGFSDRAAFEQFAQDVDRLDASWMAGYWMPGADRTVFRCGSQSGSQSGLPSESPSKDAPQQGILATTLTHESGTVAHEAAHQLLHRLGVQRRSPNGPLWLSEGLAMAFEGCASGDSRPFSLPYGRRDDRSRQLRDLAAQGHVPPLAALVATPRLLSRDVSEIKGFYLASWSLAKFLSESDPSAFAAYLASLRAEASGLSAKRNVEIFVASFGEIDAVAARWRRAAMERSTR
ncbi:MAG: DUF1570 domain-containing protein [Phycisphaerae bacterium]|nr:DUF1570 domain-containing protein [Phycisphaerae bacterium]